MSAASMPPASIPPGSIPPGSCRPAGGGGRRVLQGAVGQGDGRGEALCCEGLLGHVGTSRGEPASSACMCGAHARRRASPRSAQWPSILPDGVRALIVVVTHCQRAALLLHLALRQSRPVVVT